MTIFISCTADFLTSSLSSLIPWTANPPSRSQKAKLPSARNQYHLQLGLETPIQLEEPKQSPKSIHNSNPSIVHCYTLTRTPKRQSSPLLSLSSSVFFRSSVTDDVIGTESGDYMISSLSNIEGFKKMVEKSDSESSHSRSRYRNATMKQIPPPLSTLRAETDDLPGRMTWVFKREFTKDGRLIIRTEKVQKRREHLLPHRENGRLVMKLVAADDAVCCEECGKPLKEEEDEEEIEDMEFNEEEAEEHEDEDADEEEAESEDSLEQKLCFEDENEHGRGGNLRKGLTYGGGSGQESDPFWEGIGIGGGNGYLGQPGSPFRPMTTVK